MSINKLCNETIEELCSSLERVPPTMDWKVLMRKGFRLVYTEDDIDMIAKGERPAKALLDDLDCREKTLGDLVTALWQIGHRKAVSIIKKGAKENGIDIRGFDSGQPPSRSVIRQPQENTCIEHMYPSSRCTPWLQHGEQAETLPFPVQESASTGQWPPRDLQLDANSFQTVCKQLIGGI